MYVLPGPEQKRLGFRREVLKYLGEVVTWGMRGMSTGTDAVRPRRTTGTRAGRLRRSLAIAFIFVV